MREALLKHDVQLQRLHDQPRAETCTENVFTLARWFTVIDADEEMKKRAQAFATALASVPRVRAWLDYSVDNRDRQRDDDAVMGTTVIQAAALRIVHGALTYDPGNGRYARFPVRDIERFGLVELLRAEGYAPPVERVPVFQRGRRIGTVRPSSP